jgi:peptidoglycan/LPS O-acetylase OafA/YrhL
MRGFGGLMLLVLVVGTILRYWLVIAVAAGVIAALLLLWWFTCRLDRWLDAWERRRGARAAERAAIAQRADEQHRLVLAGDDRGVYGDYAPKQID